MALYDLKLLDCTLRDGGYVNDWKWGFSCAKAIIRALTRANVDVVEVGFLRNVNEYDSDITVCNHIEELNLLLPDEHGNTVYSAMAMRSNYDVSKLTPYNGTGIELIRITAHDYDIIEGMDFACEVKAKGYKLSINPINIMGYSDEQILRILQQVNEIQPYQFSIVDTFGSMKRRDLDRIVNLVDHNLDRRIRVALHLHENMALSCCLAQRFVDFHLNRPIAVDGSLMGMGRVPGNLPIELIADYLNDYGEGVYDIDYIMDAIQDYIAPLKGEAEWGYSPAYYLSARYNLHRNYAEYYLKKGDLTNRDINLILARFAKEKATAFDRAYADQMYIDYKNNTVDDTKSWHKLQEELYGKVILVMAPGISIINQTDVISDYINKNKPVIISVNFVPEDYASDYAFFSNNKRFSQLTNKSCKVIITSNVDYSGAEFVINYNRLSSAFEQGYNSLVMLLKLLKNIGIGKVAVAGADGYNGDKISYYKSSINTVQSNWRAYNDSVASALKKIAIDIEFLTESLYAAL